MNVAYAVATDGLDRQQRDEFDRWLLGEPEDEKAKAREQRAAQDQLMGFGTVTG